jgi:hypothetical protein
MGQTWLDGDNRMIWDPTLLLESVAGFVTSLVQFIIQIINIFFLKQ